MYVHGWSPCPCPCPCPCSCLLSSAGRYSTCKGKATIHNHCKAPPLPVFRSFHLFICLYIFVYLYICFCPVRCVCVGGGGSGQPKEGFTVQGKNSDNNDFKTTIFFFLFAMIYLPNRRSFSEAQSGLVWSGPGPG